MAKIYDRNQPGREYRAPVESVKAQKRAMAILVALILGLVVVLLLYRMARGEDLQGSERSSQLPVISTLLVTDR